MDTSGLSSSLSLVAFLVAFAYLSIVENAAYPGAGMVRPLERLGRLIFSLRLLRLASAVAALLSAQALVWSQRSLEDSPSVAFTALVALALVAFLATTDRAMCILSSRHRKIASALAFPLQTPLLRLLRLSRREDAMAFEPGGTNGDERHGNGLDPLEADTLVITEEEQASLDARERLMIRSILRLDESTAREVMVPRVDMIAVESDTPLTTVANRMLEYGHSRLPVYGETVDNILGVVYSRDLLPLLGKTEGDVRLDQVIRPAFFIPESKRLDELLRELQERRVQMAMVVDEYGGIEGLVTLEDLLEEIVGEIEDEFSRTIEPRVVPTANGEIIVDARVTLDYLSNLFSTPIDIEDVDTVGGLVYSALGKMPEVGDEVLHNGLRIEVVSLLGRRIRKLKLGKTETQEVP